MEKYYTSSMPSIQKKIPVKSNEKYQNQDSKNYDPTNPYVNRG